MNARSLRYCSFAIVLVGILGGCGGCSATSSTTVKMYVSDRISDGIDSINVYAANPRGTLNEPDYEAPLATITGSNTRLSSLQGIAVDASGKLYVVNDGFVNHVPTGVNSILVYAANPSGTLNEAPLATITGSNTRLSDPSGIAVDARGKIYVADDTGSILVFPADPSGTLNEAPLATITGSYTRLGSPRGIAVDARGTIYVLNSYYVLFSESINVYAANPSGTLNEAPLATITGTNTGLQQPNDWVNRSSSIAVDASGNIYVLETIRGDIIVYAANPSGTLNEAPLATMTDSVEGLTYVDGIVVH